MKTILLTGFFFIHMLAIKSQAFLFFGEDKQVVASQLAVIYFPFPPSSPHGWEALPTTNGLWTRERMLRDIKRLKALNSSMVLLALSPERLTPPSPYFVNDCRTFIDLCKADNITVLPLISSATFIPRNDQAVIVSCLLDVWNKNTDEPKDRILCFLAEKATSWRVRNPGVQFVSMPVSSASKPSTINGRTWLFVSVSEEVTSQPSAREREKDVDDRLKALGQRSAPVAVLCFYAWNDYEHSQVIEPNTVDGDSLFQMLVKWAKRHISDQSS